MSKYQPLSEHLAGSAGDEWQASFSDLEQVLGFSLPKAARTSRAWWANDPEKSHSRAWAGQGWEVGDVDHAAERVVFRKGAASGAVLAQAAHLEPLKDAAAAGPASVGAEPSPPIPQVSPRTSADRPGPVAETPKPAAAPQPKPDAPKLQGAASPPPPGASAQPPAMREAAEEASARMHANRALGAATLVSAGVAVVAGLGALVMKGIVRRR